MNNKDIFLIGEAYKKQILEASKGELAMPVIKDAVLKDLNKQLDRNMPRLVNIAKNSKFPYAKNRLKELLKARDELTNEQDNQRIFDLIGLIKDLSDYFELYIRIPKAFEGLENSSLGKNYTSLHGFGKDKGTIY